MFLLRQAWLCSLTLPVLQPSSVFFIVYLMSLYSWLWDVAFGGTIGLILLYILVSIPFLSLLVFQVCAPWMHRTQVCLHWLLPSATFCLPSTLGGVLVLSLLGVAEGEACGCTQVQTTCLLIQYYRYMSDIMVHALEKLVGSAVG